ncbi:hypothetical protein SISSUDRAFT_530448 [Sistotremastrum suecicum HHB10207 ss-3]|uniref:Uncharacterized protein n=1 Tax=Sistotremastrum suecicum HHB10207 ss-3 TaxID=1314776 RepID=A0A166F3A4_9AGAM|nr:hypothetical protein SISSUDRAFT_530448 [Sistotremastrum suecicum HHB10207 ss-3]
MRKIRPGVMNPSTRASAPSVDAYPPSIQSSSSDDDGGSFKSCVVEPPSLPSSTASTASPSSNASTAGDVLLIDFESDRSRAVPIPVSVQGGYEAEGRSSVRDSRMTLGSDLDPFSSINSIASLSLRMSTLSTLDTEGTGIGTGGMRISGTSFLDTITDSVRSTSTRGSDREGDGEGDEIDLEQVFEASILPSSPPRLYFTTSNDPHDPPPSTAPDSLPSSHTQLSTTSTNQYLYSSPRSPQKLPSRRTIPTEWRAHSIDVPKSVYDPSTPGLEGFNEAEEGVVIRDGSVGRGGVKLSLDIGVELEDVAARDVPSLSRDGGDEGALDLDGEGEWIDVGRNLNVRDVRSGKGKGRGSSIQSGRSGRSVRSGRSGRSGRVSTKSYSVDLSMLGSSPGGGFAGHSPSDIGTAGHSHHPNHAQARTNGRKLGGVVFEYDDGGLKRSRSLWDAGSSRRSMISEGEGAEESEDEKEMERMRNVWRARKMTKVFGSEPPAALYKVSLKSPSQTKYSYPSRKSSLGKAAAAGAGTGLKAVKTHSTPSSPRKSSAAKAREPRPTHPYAYAHNYAYATPSSAEADESITPPASPSTAGSHNRRMDGAPLVSPVTPDDDNEYPNITPASTTFEDSVLVISSSNHSDDHPHAQSILSIEGTDGLSVPLPYGNGAKGADTLSLLSFASVSVSSFSTITTQVVPSQPSPHELRRLRAKKLSNFFGVDTPHLPPPSPLPAPPPAPSAALPTIDPTINSPANPTRPSLDTITPIPDSTGRQSRKLQKSTTRSSTDRPPTPGRSRSRADSRAATASDEGHPRTSGSRPRTAGRPRAGTKSRVFVEAGRGVVVDQEDEMGMQEVMAVLRRLR